MPTTDSKQQLTTTTTARLKAWPAVDVCRADIGSGRHRPDLLYSRQWDVAGSTGTTPRQTDTTHVTTPTTWAAVGVNDQLRGLHVKVKVMQQSIVIQHSTATDTLCAVTQTTAVTEHVTLFSHASCVTTQVPACSLSATPITARDTPTNMSDTARCCSSALTADWLRVVAVVQDHSKVVALPVRESAASTATATTCSVEPSRD
jgi:hypothetical protein